MTIQKRYKDEENWEDFPKDLAIACLRQVYDNPEALITEMEANPNLVISTPYALYRATKEEVNQND